MPIRSTYGVIDLVRFAGEPARVPEALIEEIRNRESPAGLYCFETPALRQGERVRLVSGSMAGLEGIFESYSSSERVILLLNILGQQSRVQVSMDLLERAAVR